MNLAGSSEWDGLTVRAKADEPGRAVVAGEVRRLVIEVENPSGRDRTGKLVHGSVIPTANDYWILVERFTVPAHGTHTVEVPDYKPIIPGHCYWFLFTKGSFEGNGGVPDADLKDQARRLDANYRPLLSFPVYDRDELAERRASRTWEWVRWAILVAITTAGVIVASLLLLR